MFLPPLFLGVRQVVYLDDLHVLAAGHLNPEERLLGLAGLGAAVASDDGHRGHRAPHEAAAVHLHNLFETLFCEFIKRIR